MKIVFEMFDAEFSLNFKLIEGNSPFMLNVAGVYLIKDDAGEIIYVGISKNIGSRIYTHKGNSHVKGLSSEISDIFYYIEEDVYKREALEKLLIAYFKPKFNKTSLELSARKRTDEDVIKVKYLIKQRYAKSTIKEITGYSRRFIEGVSFGHIGEDIEIPDDYVIELDLSGFSINPKLRDEQALEEAYKLYMQGHTRRFACEETGVNINLFKKMLLGKGESLSKFFKELEIKYGKKEERKKLTD